MRDRLENGIILIFELQLIFLEHIEQGKRDSCMI